MIEARYMNYPMHEEATELNQVNTIATHIIHVNCVCNNVLYT